MLATTALADALPALAAHLPAAGAVHALGPDWMDPQTLIDRFGDAALVGIALVIFIETGLLFPILPGDSLLFTAGALVAQGTLHINLPVLCVILFVAAFLGDQTGYLIGRFAGPKIFDRPDSKIFKRQYIDQTNAYFDKYGGRTIVIARFVPIVRTYAPVAAGVGRMGYRHFVGFNALGALLWAVGITVLGYLLGNITFVKDNIEALIVLIVLISVVPMVVEVLRARRQEKAAAQAAARAGDAAAATVTGSAPEAAGAPTATGAPTAVGPAAPGAAPSPGTPGTFHDDGTRPPRHAR
ncbi:VTT domain-containing protein [Puerhibacterium puerhi]|uniref:VTT domain-containing protein n=1 Tax=Puerhibacterium puerhi TaxID=2692623 RepID=UPI00135C8127|nr:VTT domain-containing protein [Puerhibacterium puerhi]